MAKLPLVAIVTGRPGSGKATLAGRLTSELRCPLVSRDQIKEGMLRTMGIERADDRGVVDRVFETFFSEIALLVRSEVSVVAEAAFQHKVWAPRLGPLCEIADVRIVVCQVSAEIAAQRREQRSRQDPLFDKFHPGAVDKDYAAPDLDVPTLLVDTTEGYSPTLVEIVAFLR